MEYTVEKSLRDFEFWSGAESRAGKCSDEELDSIEEFLEEIEPEDGWTATTINDMFWFEFDTLAQHLGYKDEEDFDRHHDPDYIDDDELKGKIDNWFQKFLDKAKDEELIINIAVNLFDYDGELDGGSPYSNDFFNCINFLRHQHDEDALYEALFEDDRGEYETDGVIPTWEDFRDDMMVEAKQVIKTNETDNNNITQQK